MSIGEGNPEKVSLVLEHNSLQFGFLFCGRVGMGVNIEIGERVGFWKIGIFTQFFNFVVPELYRVIMDSRNLEGI